jgi:Fe-S cluster assembly protein SufD
MRHQFQRNIMVQQENILDHYQRLYSDYAAQLNGAASQPLHRFQKKNFEALSKVKFPDRKHEDWKNTAVQKLMSLPYQLPVSKPDFKFEFFGQASYIINIINGQILYDDSIEELLQTGVKIIPVNEALENTSWKEVFGQWISAPEVTANRAFEFLNFTFQTSGIFIDIPRNTVLPKPLEIRIAHDQQEISFSNPLYFIRVGESSQVEIIERFEPVTQSTGISSESLINALGYVHLDKNASLHHLKWQNLPATQNLIYKLFVTQDKDSRFETIAIDFGGKVIRNNIECELEASNTYTSILGAYIAKEKQSMDHQTRINHKVPHCESHELYKGILEGQASGAFNGKVFVHKDAQKTNAYQQNDTLVLSPHALMNSKPQLEIYADDVKCSHGATIGQIDEKALFYLKSRGLPTLAATQMLKRAFIGEIIDKIPDEATRQNIFNQLSID